MVEQWLLTNSTQAWLVVVSTLAIFAAVITYTRIAGLRSFSKMSGFDFASTVAVGSIMASIAVTEASLVDGLIGLAVLYGAQVLIALLRRHSLFSRVIDNEPTLLMAGTVLLEDNLRSCRITKGDIWGKLREANVTSYDQILGVVFETTGDINVLHGSGPLEPGLLEGVVDADRLTREAARPWNEPEGDDDDGRAADDRRRP